MRGEADLVVCRQPKRGSKTGESTGENGRKEYEFDSLMTDILYGWCRRTSR